MAHGVCATTNIVDQEYPYENQTMLSGDLGTLASVIVALGLSRWKLLEFSDKTLLEKSKAMTPWEDVKVMRITGLRRLQMETDDDTYVVSRPQEWQAFAELVRSKIGDRAKLEILRKDLGGRA
jgi:hypothetical protein